MSVLCVKCDVLRHISKDCNESLCLYKSNFILKLLFSMIISNLSMQMLNLTSMMKYRSFSKLSSLLLLSQMLLTTIDQLFELILI